MKKTLNAIFVKLPFVLVLSALFLFGSTTNVFAAKKSVALIDNMYNGKFIIMKESGAKLRKQVGESFSSNKYGKQVIDGENVCSTYAEAACGPSAIASAVSKYRDATTYSIGEYIADRFDSYRNVYTEKAMCRSGTSDAAIPGVIGTLSSNDGYMLRARKIKKWSEVKKAIDKGTPIIFKTRNKVFTAEGHYLVISGKAKRKSDKAIFYLINDSGKRNITAANETAITTNNGGYWAVEKTKKKFAESTPQEQSELLALYK